MTWPSLKQTFYVSDVQTTQALSHLYLSRTHALPEVLVL